jgi:outer membrane protein
MRVLLRASSIALATSLIVTGAVGAQTATTSAPVTVKIGYINSAQLLQEAPGRAEAEAQFDREVGAYRTQLQRMNDSLNTLMAAFDRDAAKLDTTTRAARGKVIRDRETEYQTRARGLERVQAVIESIRQEDGYSMILDVGAQASVVVAADKRLDLTDRVLARLKSQGVPPTTPASGAVPQPAGVTRPKK